MKKITLIILCLTCSMMLSAQIQRNILGQTLGVSTKDEVYSSLLSKGAFFENMMGEEAIFVKDVRFGGYPPAWNDDVYDRVMDQVNNFKRYN